MKTAVVSIVAIMCGGCVTRDYTVTTNHWRAMPGTVFQTPYSVTAPLGTHRALLWAKALTQKDTELLSIEAEPKPNSP